LPQEVSPTQPHSVGDLEIPTKISSNEASLSDDHYRNVSNIDEEFLGHVQHRQFSVVPLVIVNPDDPDAPLQPAPLPAFDMISDAGSYGSEESSVFHYDPYGTLSDLSTRSRTQSSNRRATVRRMGSTRRYSTMRSVTKLESPKMEMPKSPLGKDS